MKQFIFQVAESATSPGLHSWVAIDNASGEEIPLPDGGLDRTYPGLNGANLFGQYPEIQRYLADKHQITVPLIYTTQIDDYQRNTDGSIVLVFHRQDAEVTVHDIPRRIWGIGVSA